MSALFLCNHSGSEEGSRWPFRVLTYSIRVSAPNMVQRLVGGSAFVPGKVEQQSWNFCFLTIGLPICCRRVQFLLLWLSEEARRKKSCIWTGNDYLTNLSFKIDPSLHFLSSLSQTTSFSRDRVVGCEIYMLRNGIQTFLALKFGRIVTI